MEPTKEFNSCHFMKLGGRWDSNCIVNFRYFTTIIPYRLNTAIQISDTNLKVKEVLISNLFKMQVHLFHAISIPRTATRPPQIPNPPNATSGLRAASTDATSTGVHPVKFWDGQ